MKMPLISAIAMVLVLLGCSARQVPPMADTNERAAYNADQVSNYFQSLSEKEWPGFAYLIAKDGKIIVQASVGLANVENQIAIDADTKFRAGSITKQFTAVSILQLAEKGKLSLDDSVTIYFPSLTMAKDVTIKHMLDHTSGIWDHEKDEEFPFPVEEAVDPETHIAYIQKHALFFKPGEQWRYCNNSYFLLGLIVEKVSKKPLAAYFKDNIFSPLGMKNSGLYNNHIEYPHSAVGYAIKDGKPVRETNVNMTTWNGAAALYTTVKDLFIWSEAFHNGKVISSASYKEAITPHKFTNGFVPYVGYGYGLGIEDVAGKPTIGHPGYLRGFHSELLRLPEDNITYIFLSNINGGQLKTTDRISQKVIEIMYKNRDAK